MPLSIVIENYHYHYNYGFIGLFVTITTIIISRHNIKSVGLPLKKIPGFLRPTKDDLGLKTPGMCSMPCEYGQVYTGQTGRSIETRIKEHLRHIRLEHPDKSVVAKHINLGHSIQLQNTTILSTKSRYMDRMIREAIEIELHLNNTVNHGSPSFTLSKDVGSLQYISGSLF
jgi:hypothetical protein